MHNFTLVNCDTDSIMVCKPDQSEFTNEEQTLLLKELKRLFPEQISWEPDGYYQRVIIAKAKNYVLYDGKKLTHKGSALKASTKEPALKEFIQLILDAMINKQTNYTEIYNKYVKEINDVQDIKRWVSRKTISATTLSSERENEAKIVRAIEGSDYKEGDRVYMYFTSDGELKLVEKFSNDYCKNTLYGKLYKTAEVFETILPVKEVFPNFSLKRNKKKLEELLNGT